MPAKTKTSYTEASVVDFIHSFVDNEQKKQDSFRLIDLMRAWSGFEPKMWGPSIIGFGNYHYQYASGHEGDAPLIAFSPRKAALTLYITVPDQEHQALLDELGKYKMSKACIYVRKLDDLNLDALEKLSKATIRYLNEKYP